MLTLDPEPPPLPPLPADRVLNVVPLGLPLFFTPRPGFLTVPSDLESWLDKDDLHEAQKKGLSASYDTSDCAWTLAVVSQTSRPCRNGIRHTAILIRTPAHKAGAKARAQVYVLVLTHWFQTL